MEGIVESIRLALLNANGKTRHNVLRSRASLLPVWSALLSHPSRANREVWSALCVSATLLLRSRLSVNGQEYIAVAPLPSMRATSSALYASATLW